MERAVKRNYITGNPFKGNRKALWDTEPEPVPTILEPAESDKLLDACQDDRWRAICVVGYCASLRRGGMVALEWQDVDFESRLLHVWNEDDHTTKSRKNRDVPMTSDVVRALGALRAGKFPGGYVFQNVAGRQMLNIFWCLFWPDCQAGRVG